MAQATSYKIVLIGDVSVGKTTWVKKFLTSNFEDKYFPTLGVGISPICMETNRGPMVFNLWDCAGNDKYEGLRNGYYLNGNGVILMYDSTNLDSKAHLQKWSKDVSRVCGKNNYCPMVEVATKCDSGIYSSGSSDCIGISSQCNFNLVTPLLELVRKIRNDAFLEFINVKL